MPTPTPQNENDNLREDYDETPQFSRAALPFQTRVGIGSGILCVLVASGVIWFGKRDLGPAILLLLLSFPIALFTAWVSYGGSHDAINSKKQYEEYKLAIAEFVWMMSVMLLVVNCLLVLVYAGIFYSEFDL